MSFKKPTLKQQIATLSNDLHSRSTDAHDLFFALHNLVEAKNFEARQAAEKAALEVLGKTCRCSCGSKISYNMKPWMCERCMST